MLDVLYFCLSWRPSLAADTQCAWVEIINCLAARVFGFSCSPLSLGFPQRRPLNLIKRPQFMISPRVRLINDSLRAAYKQPLFCYAASFCSVKPQKICRRRDIGEKWQSATKHAAFVFVFPSDLAWGTCQVSVGGGGGRSSPTSMIRKLEKAVAVRNSLLERFSGKFWRCWKKFRDFLAA